MRPRLLALVSEQLHAVQQRIAEFQLLRQQLERVVQRLQTALLMDHTEGCRCLDFAALPAGQTVPQQPLPLQSGGRDMHRQGTLEPLTLLPAMQCGDGSWAVARPWWNCSCRSPPESWRHHPNPQTRVPGGRRVVMPLGARDSEASYGRQRDSSSLLQHAKRACAPAPR